MRKAKADVLVVGSGGAGLRAALSAKETNKSLDVKIVTKGELLKDSVTGTSYSDRMAFHATLDTTEPYTEDSWKYHAEDIFIIGGMVSDQNLAEVLAKNSQDAFEYLDRLGVPFVREEARVKQFRTDGSKYARACFTGPDTAVQISKALAKKVKEEKIEVIENTMIQGILLDEENRVKGAWGIGILDNDYFFIDAPAIIMATGGAGQVFLENLFPPLATGDGWTAALRAGAEFVNMEFIQIGLSSKETKIACSGSFMRSLPEIVNSEGEDLLLKYYKDKYSQEELINILFSKGWSWPLSYEEESHIIDVAVAKEIQEGRQVFLSYTQNPDFLEKDSLPERVLEWYRSSLGEDLVRGDLFTSPLLRLKKMNREVYELLRSKGINLDEKGKFEIVPAVQHFQGGIKINEKAETNIEGLYACGEAAGGQHGANRPGGNSLLDTQVFGKISGQEAAIYSSSVKRSKITGEEVETIKKQFPRFSREVLGGNWIRQSIREIMTRNAGVIRVPHNLREAYKEISSITEREILNVSESLKDYLETLNIHLLSQLLLLTMYERKESRGPHLLFKNEDSMELYPRDDGAWAYHYIVAKLKYGAITLEKRPVNRGNSKR